MEGLRSLEFVIHNEKGGRITSNAFKIRYDKLKKCREKYPQIEFNGTFHDIKAKSISDYKDENKQEFSGHKTASLVAIYDRLPKEVKGH